MINLETSDHPELQPVPIDEARYPSLDGRTVLITGGASGIGRYLVAGFCAQRARVSFIDIDGEASARIADAAEHGTGNRPQYEIADLTDIAALRAAAGRLSAITGEFRVLINNAGNDDRVPLSEVTPDYWDNRINTNLRHQLFAAQTVASGMAGAGGGAIVNMGSTSWMQKAGGLICYTTAKAGVEGLTRGLARELGPQKIRVNSIAPGWILTERQVTRAKAIYKDKFDDYLSRQCLKEFLLPPDVVRMALWLAADDSRLVTGQTFIVDGGVV